jgi:hypothetical protein
VTRVYVRDSLLIAMAADDESPRGAGSVRIDQIGKVFIALGQDMRKCLICDGVFTRQNSAEHANVSCRMERLPGGD